MRGVGAEYREHEGSGAEDREHEGSGAEDREHERSGAEDREHERMGQKTWNMRGVVQGILEEYDRKKNRDMRRKGHKRGIYQERTGNKD